MERIEIYWDDLTEAKQKEILEFLGDNGNYDVIPIATVEYDDCSLATPLNIDLIATYEELYGIPEDECITEYFADYGGFVTKMGIDDTDIRPVLDKALEAIGLTAEEFHSREREFMYRRNIETEMKAHTESFDMTM